MSNILIYEIFQSTGPAVFATGEQVEKLLATDDKIVRIKDVVTGYYSVVNKAFMVSTIVNAKETNRVRHLIAAKKLVVEKGIVSRSDAEEGVIL